LKRKKRKTMKYSSALSTLILAASINTASSLNHDLNNNPIQNPRSIQSDNDDKLHPLLRNSIQPFGFQSTKSNGHDMAASIVSSPNPDQGFFITGTTTGIVLSPEAESSIHLGMQCYIMQVKPFEENWVWVKKLGAYKDALPTGTACTSVHAMRVNNYNNDDFNILNSVTRIVVTGYTEGDEIFTPENGILEFSKPESETMERNKVNGFVIVLEIPNALSQKNSINSSEIKLVAGKMLTSYPVQYPLSVVSIDEENIVVASLVTDDDSLNYQARIQETLGQVSDFEPYYKYGNFFNIQLERLTFDSVSTESEQVMQRLWSKTYSTDNDRGAHVSSLLYDSLLDELIFAGTTHGQGEAFGTLNPEMSNGNDFDGFITKVMPSNGELATTENPYSVRLESNPGKEEFIHGMCTHGRALYIVGSTNSILDPTSFDDGSEIGDMEQMTAFIQKRELDDLDFVLWTRQVKAADISTAIEDPNIEGLGCAVAHDQELVYLSGTVSSGASVVKGAPGTGLTDVFVQAYVSTPGTPSPNFPIVQIGSTADDHLAIDKSLATDQYGNAVLCGTTRGSLIKEKEIGATNFAQSYADIFVMSFLAEDGDHLAPLETPGSGPIFRAPNSLKEKSNSNRSAKIIGASLFASGSAILLFLLAFQYGKRRSVNQIEDQQDKDIARYLEEFEGGKAGPSFSEGDGQIYDVNNYYGGGNLAAGKDKDEAMVLPGEVMFNSGDSGTTTANTATYDELMESYKSIQNDITTNQNNSAQFVIDNPDFNLDLKVI